MKRPDCTRMTPPGSQNDSPMHSQAFMVGITSQLNDMADDA